jgi:hypothetical protein
MQLYGVLGIIVGVTFALEGILGAPGAAFAVTGVLVGAIYGVLGVAWYGGRGSQRDRDRDRNRDEGAG